MNALVQTRDGVGVDWCSIGAGRGHCRRRRAGLMDYWMDIQELDKHTGVQVYSTVWAYRCGRVSVLSVLSILRTFRIPDAVLVPS